MKMSVPEVAARLEVNERRVRQLIELGRLRAERVGGRWIVDSRAANELQAEDRSAGRPFSARNAWAILTIASGNEPGWVSRAERVRLAEILERRGIETLRPKLGRRALRVEWYVHPSLLGRLVEDPRTVVTGAGAVDSLIEESFVEVYAPDGALSDLLSEYFADAEPERANVAVHAIDDVWPFEPGQRVVAPIVAALDLLDGSSDTRSEQAAKELLADI